MGTLTYCTPRKISLLEVPAVNAAAPKANVIPDGSRDNPCESAPLILCSVPVSTGKVGQPLTPSQAQDTSKRNSAEGIHAFSWGRARG